MDYLQMFPETIDAVRRYSPEDRCYLYEAMAAYAFYGVLPEWHEDDLKWLVWEALKQRVDAASKYAEKQRTNGSKGGRPPKTQTNPEKPRETQRNPEKPTESEKSPEEESEEESDKETERKEKQEREKRKRFSPPTTGEVRAYIAEKGLRVDAERFVAYYESNGWRVGRNPMRDWKAAVRTWARSNFDTGGRTKTVVAQQYDQRDYTQEPEQETPSWMLERWHEMQKGGTA